MRADDGYRLWLRYDRVDDKDLLDEYRSSITTVVMDDGSATLRVARSELLTGLKGLLDMEMRLSDSADVDGSLVVGTPASSPFIASLELDAYLSEVGDEGFGIRRIQTESGNLTVVFANTDVGVLYGVFRLLRLIQTHESTDLWTVLEHPRIQHRLQNHWDNLDRTVERGYAGFSLWDWHKLPDYIDPRYTDYARATASLGINGSVLTNVNADATVLTEPYLVKVAALANVFRPYGIRVYLTARFSAPIEIGGLPTADPLDPDVVNWWKKKADEIYRHIPDFGGFLVKANSEGQPGPQDYNRSHAEGANMLADAVAPHGGIVMWRAFVYSNEEPVDRAKQAFNEFTPLDGEFRDNVLIQVKNGPIDFQPREPFHPLFGAMPKTPLMMEFMITKEYLGFETHLVYLATQYKEVLESDTYARGPGSTVAKVIDGSLHGYERSGIAGVLNTGTDRNWMGSIFNQANWYAFGRLAWDHRLSASEIAEEWVRMTFGNELETIAAIKSMMARSWPAAANYMTPLGLHHLMGRGHHYGPGPWVSGGPRADWTSVYYHRADSIGVGFDRTATGSNAVSQYFDPLDKIFGDIDRVPEKYLLWFHHVPWHYTMKSGLTLWDELASHYQEGVDEVRAMQRTWGTLEGKIDDERYDLTRDFLAIQEKEARWWRDSSLLYFQTFSRMPLPDNVEAPEHTLEYYMSLEFPSAPGHW
jgi:alpha-glucuronidase